MKRLSKDWAPTVAHDSKKVGPSGMNRKLATARLGGIWPEAVCPLLSHFPRNLPLAQRKQRNGFMEILKLASLLNRPSAMRCCFPETLFRAQVLSKLRGPSKWSERASMSSAGDALAHRRKRQQHRIGFAMLIVRRLYASHRSGSNARQVELVRARKRPMGSSAA